MTERCETAVVQELVNRQQFNSWLHGQSGAREAAKKGGTEQGPG